MKHLLIDQADGVQVIRMAWSTERPGFHVDTFDATADALRWADTRNDITCSVFMGLPHCFCYGADASSFGQTDELGRLSDSALGFFRALINSKKPLIAGVDGPAAGIGMTMLLHFDAVFATPNSSFSAPFVEWGLIPDAASTILFPKLLGPARAFDVLCLGRILSPSEASECGLVTAVVSADEIESRAMGAAQRLGRLSPSSLRSTRDLLRHHRSQLIRQAKLENSIFQELLGDEGTQRRMKIMGRAIKRALSTRDSRSHLGPNTSSGMSHDVIAR